MSAPIIDLSARVSDVSFSPPVALAQKQVLNVGAGPIAVRGLHPGFDRSRWREIRLDIDWRAKPDLVGSVVAMQDLVEDASIDAVWCSHSLEHLAAHDVVTALRECRRILKPDGFALVTSPDLSAIAKLICDQGVDEMAYMSPAGPITPLDMLFGHGPSIKDGSVFMAHKTGFTVESLGRRAAEAGFAEARVASGSAFDLWALLMMPESDASAILAPFHMTNVGLMFG